MAEPNSVLLRPLSALRPSQLYLVSEKVEAVRQEITKESILLMEPIPVMKSGDNLVMTDGHTRAFVAFLVGADIVPTIDEDMDDDLDWHAYEVCTEWCRQAGVLTAGDLTGRIVTADEFERLWIERCSKIPPTYNIIERSAITESIVRCPWGNSHPLLSDYHDVEWGVPKFDDRDQFEHLLLEVFQAGLSWLTMLKRHAGFKAAFADFDPAKIAAFEEVDFERLLHDPGIIMNRAKINAAIHDAGLFLKVSEEFDGFFNFARQFAPKAPHRFTEQSQIPALTPESEAMSKELKRRGFKFLGSTICYAHLQSVGLVNDHLESCFRYEPIEKLRRNAGL
jgi:DNA-3-methyladenine glycosylase I